jgi:hypothetical protein
VDKGERIVKEDLYESVKFVRGENFITVEETGLLTGEEVKRLADELVKDPNLQHVDHLTLLVHSELKAEVGHQLAYRGFSLHDEVYFVRCDLEQKRNDRGPFLLKSLGEVEEDTFKETWRRSMEGSLNAPQSLDMDEQMRTVEKELGPTYKDTCLIAYEGAEPIGVIMPHIEPGTDDEGRIFYFGLIPEARGRKKSVLLYNQGLAVLKTRFHASYSVGATSIHNTPMLKVFEKTGCTVTGHWLVYKRSL